MSRMYLNRKLSAIDLFPDSYLASFDVSDTYQNMQNNIRNIRKAAGYSLEAVADMVGSTKSTIMKLEKGEIQLTTLWMEKLGRALNCSPFDLISAIHIQPKTQIVGYVGAGIVYAYDDFTKGGGLDEVDTPRGFEGIDLVAVRVRGDSMRPMLRDGWLLFYTRNNDGVPQDSLGQVCIVKQVNEGYMVREVKSGSVPGHYHLIAYNGDTSFDVRLEWAAKIVDIRPS